MKTILVCTPTWNKAEFLAGMMESLRDTADAGLYRHVVVDNGSGDDTLAVCRWWGVDTICNNANVGLAQSLNQAIGRLKYGQAFMKLDDDIIFTTSGWMDDMLSVLKEPNVGGVALPRLGREDDQVSGSSFNVNGVHVVGAGRRWWTNCALYKYEAVLTLGSFWQPGLYGFEDKITGIRLNVLGWKLPSPG